MSRIGGKRCIYISTGYDFDPFAEGRNSRDRVMGGRFSDPMRFLLDEENPYFSMGRVTADIDLYRLTARADAVGQPRQCGDLYHRPARAWQASWMPANTSISRSGGPTSRRQQAL